MRPSSRGGFTLLEVLTAFVIAALGLTWFLYVLSHTYSTTARLLDRLKLYDVTTPLRAHILEELSSGRLSREELETLAQDQEALSSYIIPSSPDIVLKFISSPKEVSFQPGDNHILVEQWTLRLEKTSSGIHTTWRIYTPGEQGP